MENCNSNHKELKHYCFEPVIALMLFLSFSRSKAGVHISVRKSLIKPKHYVSYSITIKIKAFKVIISDNKTNTFTVTVEVVTTLLHLFVKKEVTSKWRSTQTHMEV